MNINIKLDKELQQILEQVLLEDESKSYSQAARKALKLYGSFLFASKGKYIKQNASTENRLLAATEIYELAADLPGMSLAVIQSHLVRFPKVTPEIYRRILERLNAQHAEGTLKNPEAAAYGMCKLAQSGKLPDFLKPEPQAPATTPTEATNVPFEALNPFAK